MLTQKQLERYSRQIISPLIGEEGQKKISNAKVLQIGAGGLGSPFSLYLTAAGIKKLTIVDNDVVSLSNLQRQILYNETHLGKPKALCAKEVLCKLNSEVQIDAYQEFVNETTVKKYVKDQDFIVDCSDNLNTKFLVNQTGIKYNLRCVISGIKDFYGQIMTINPKKSACYECVFPRPSEQETTKLPSSPLPVIGVTPGVMGTLEALEVIKTILGKPNLENYLMVVNLIDLTFNKIKIVRDEKCICSK